MNQNATTFPSRMPAAEKATNTPKPTLPAPYASVVSTISATLMPVYASVAQLQIRKIDDRCWSLRTSERPARTSRQCVRPIRATTLDWSLLPIRTSRSAETRKLTAFIA